MKRNLLKSALLALMVLVGGNAWAADPLTETLEVKGYVKSHFYDFVNGNYDGTTLTTFDDLAGLGVTAQNAVGESYGNNNWYHDPSRGLRLQAGGGRWIQFTTSIKADDYIIINGGAANEAYEISMTDGTSTTISSASDYLCFKANKDMDALKLTAHRYNFISQILIMTKDASAKTAQFTLNYLLNGEGEPVKTVSGEMAVGSTINTDASFFVESVKYFRAEGEPESFTIAEGENNFSVKVRPAETFNYSLLSSLGATLAIGEGLEGETVPVGYPRYQLSEGKFYEAAVTNKEYRKTIAMNADNASATVEYTEKTGVNAVFFVEGEDVEGMTVSTANNIPVRASNAKAGVASEDVTITTLSAGKYKLHVGIFTSKSAYEDQVVNFGIGNETFAAAFTGVNLNEVASDEITLTENSDVKFIAEGSWADAQLDYLWIEKTGDYVAPFDPETAIANPSFETDGEKAASNGPLELTGWTFAGVGTQYNNTELRPAGSASTTSQFGTSDPSNGDYSLFIRQGWNGNGNVITLTSDAMATLPAGAYILSVDYKQYYSYDNDNQANQNTKLGLSVVNGENTVASTTSPAADGEKGGNVNTYFNDTDWSTLELPFTLEQELVDGNVVITFNMCGARRSDFFVDNVKLIQVPAIDGALAELKKAIDAAQALADSYAIGDVLFTYPATEITPLTSAISTAQGVYDAAESVDAVTTATQTLNAFVATFAPAMNKPETDKTYTFRLRLDVETPLYMALAESGITIAEQATALKFIETENNGEYYLSNADGTLFVGLAGNNAWTMSTAADKKAAWTFTALPDGAHRINNLVTKGRFVGTNAAEKEAGKSCYADKQTSNGNVDWIIEVSKIPTGIKTMKAGRESEAIYNLNGQKVMKAQKGLYIINGKKVVVK